MPASALPHQHESTAELEYLESQLSRIDDFQIVAEVFKQLGDTSRVRIFWLLCHCEECVINISADDEYVKPCRVPSPAPYFPKNRGLIVSRRVGKEVSR